MNWKVLLTSKTFWAGILTIGLGITQVVNGDVSTGSTTIAAGVGMICLRDAVAKTQIPPPPKA
jgi:hypothetical protein